VLSTPGAIGANNMITSTARVGIAALGAWMSISAVHLVGQAPAPEGTREFAVSGCLLRSGYAAYQLDEATVETIDGKPAPEAVKTNTTLKKWTLQGGGNLGPRVGQKVLVTGRSEWREAAAKPAAPDEPPDKPPTLEVESVETLAASCP
jgi:hypothetical protein